MIYRSPNMQSNGKCWSWYQGHIDGYRCHAILASIAVLATFVSEPRYNNAFL
jgi:hypothetical protein